MQVLDLDADVNDAGHTSIAAGASVARAGCGAGGGDASVAAGASVARADLGAWGRDGPQPEPTIARTVQVSVQLLITHLLYRASRTWVSFPHPGQFAMWWARRQEVASCARKPRSLQLSSAPSAVISFSPRRIAVATSIRSAGSACESGSSAAEIPISPSRGSS